MKWLSGEDSQKKMKTDLRRLSDGKWSYKGVRKREGSGEAEESTAQERWATCPRRRVFGKDECVGAF